MPVLPPPISRHRIFDRLFRRIACFLFVGVFKQKQMQSLEIRGIARFGELSAISSLTFTVCRRAIDQLPISVSSKKRARGAFFTEQGTPHQAEVWVSYFDEPETCKAPYIKVKTNSVTKA